MHTPELQFFKKLGHSSRVGYRKGVVFGIKSHGHIDDDTRQLFGQDTQLFVGFNFFFELTFELIGVFEERFQTAIFFDEFFCRLIAHPGESRYIVDGIAHHAEVVNDLFGAFYFKFFLHFGDAPNLNTIAHPRGAVHKNIFRNQLRKVLVGGHHKGLKPFFFGLFGECPYNIIGLIAFLNHHGYMHGF